MDTNTDFNLNLKTEPELHTETIIKDEFITEEDSCSPKPEEEPIEEENYSSIVTYPDTDNDAEQISNQTEKAIPNIIFLGSRIPNSGTVDGEGISGSVNEEGSNGYVDGESKNGTVDGKGSGTVNGESKIGTVDGGKVKSKRRLRTELELLGVDVNAEDNGEDGNNGFGDDSKVFRKYKLRKTEHISYKEPADIKPKRYDSPEDECDMSCPECQQEFENKVALLNHLRTHNIGVHEYTCSICSKTFKTNADLISHREEHSTESFLCTQCKLAFSDYYDYLLHNYEHLKQVHFKCLECGHYYKKTLYKIHIQTHFDRKLSCDICSFVANGEHSLHCHKKQHNNHGNYTCVECGKVVYGKARYEQHLGYHTGVKTFQCLYCGACFRRQSMVKIHTRIHTGEKPFSCDICGQQTRRWIDLQRHKLSHVGEKKYSCDLCGKKYLHKEYLVIHMRSHTMKSLYDCPECDRKFITATGLRTHALLKHTHERPVECTLCDKKFINNNQYRKHCRAKYHLNNVYGVNKSK